MSILKPALENIAERVAASRGGRLVPNALAPFLPVSLSMMEKHLDEMVDHSVVFPSRHDGYKTYEFSELLGSEPKPVHNGLCAYCGKDNPAEEGESLLCPECREKLGKELLELAETNAWPAKAVWQHELLYITSMTEGLVRIADVAGRSRLTLNQVKQRLADLAKRGAARQDMDFGNGTASYAFPPLRYPRKAYLRHDAFIRRHPSSLKDEWEVKIMKSFAALIIIAVICFGAAFAARLPFPIILIMGALAGAIAVWRICRHKTPAVPERIARE